MHRSIAVLALVFPLASNSATDVALMAGKAYTNRAIVLQADVACSRADAWSLWATAEGVSQFFAPAARIDARPGGEYTILFSPAKDPQGLSHGTKGARVLKAEPGQALSFEWITFAADESLGANAPPLAPRTLRDATPLPTWVELEFEALAGGGTRVRFVHNGFRDGALWEESHRWFTRAWSGVLAQMEKYCAGRSGAAVLETSSRSENNRGGARG